MTQVQKARQWHCVWDEPGGPTSHAAMVFLLPSSPLPASAQPLIYVLGLSMAQGAACAALPHIPNPAKHLQERTEQSLPLL